MPRGYLECTRGVLAGYSRGTLGILYGIISSARAARLGPRARGCVWRHRPGSRALAAGVTWTSRTANAGWAARAFHTSVVDAAGAIYVIGGQGSDSATFYADVWASTDGGARPDSEGRGVLDGYSQGY